MNVFHKPARTGEWCITGGFEFSNWTEADLTGKARQAFSNGWLGVETFGRVTFVAITQIETSELETLVTALAQHFVDIYGAPSLQAAMGVAREELEQMMQLCDGQPSNTVMTVARELSDAGVKESFRIIEQREAALDQFAIHGSLDDDPV